MKLWEPYDIPVVGLAGETGSGKTLWGLMVDSNCLQLEEPATTYVWDTEGSSAPYVGTLNFTRVDIPALLFKRLKKGTPQDTFLFWRNDLENLSPSKYRVLMLDTINTIETGLVDYVKQNPTEFGYTAKQFYKLEGLMWGAMKSEWKRLILLATQKCETLVLTTHMKVAYVDGIPTKRRIPKGKETISEVASIYMTLSRSVNSNSSQVSLPPSGICVYPGGKSRLVRMNPHSMTLEPLLPPRIKNASPSGIREYLRSPPDFSNLEDYEQATNQDEMSDDDRLQMKVAISNNLARKAEAELQLKEDAAVVSETSDLKSRVLSLMTLDEAKLMLRVRYNVKTLADLTSGQISDLDDHLLTLKN